MRFLLSMLICLPICHISLCAQARVVSLKEAIAISAKQSRIVKIAEKSGEIAYDDVMLARASLLPKINATFDQNFLDLQPAAKLGSSRAYTAEKNFYEYGFDIYQTLYDFGASSSNLRASRELFKGSSIDIERTRNQAVLELIGAYFDVLEAKRFVNVAKKEVVSVIAYRKKIGSLYRNGVATKKELLAAQAAAAAGRAKLDAARNFESVAFARLYSVLGIKPEEKIQVEDRATYQIELPRLLDALDSAQSKRPELKIYDQAIKASGFKEASARAQYFPILFGDAGYSYLDNRYQAQQDNWFAKLGVKMNIFNAGQTYASVSRERHRRDQLREQKKKLQDDLFVEVKTCHAALSNLIQEQRVIKIALREAEENLRLEQANYQEGESTPTNVLSAISTLSRAQYNYWQRTYEIQRVLASLLFTIGEDLSQKYPS